MYSGTTRGFICVRLCSFTICKLAAGVLDKARDSHHSPNACDTVVFWLPLISRFQRQLPPQGEAYEIGEEENNKRFGAIRYETGDAPPGEGCVKGEEENNKRFAAIRYEAGDARPKGKPMK